MVSLKEGVTPPETELADESPEETEALSLFWLSAEAEADQTAAEKKTLGDWFKANSPIFVIIASLLCYALLLKTLGLHLCNFLLSFFLVYYLSKGKWKTALITAVCITLAFYLIFDLSLGLRLPRGKLFKLLKSL